LHPNRLIHAENFRLAAVFALLFLVFAAVLMTTVYWIVADTQRGALLDAVNADIGTIQNGYRGEGIPEAVEVIDQRLGPTPRPGSARSEEFILLEDAAGQRLAGNLPPLPRALGLVRIAPSPRGPASPDNPSDYPRLVGKGVILGDSAYLFVGRDMHAMAAAQAHLLQAFSWITLTAVAMALLGGVLSSVRYMKRIDAISRTCHAIMEGRYAERIALGGSGDELDRLGMAINRMLDRIAALMDNVRQVSNDIAHDLRTPLTRLRHRLEHAQSSLTVGDYAQGISRAIADADQALVIFSALLRIAQIEANAYARAMTVYSLSDQLHQLIELYAPVAEDAGHALTANIAGDVRVLGDQELLMQLFVNLLENAIRHSPRGTAVHLQLDHADEKSRVSISDRGPGIPESERPKVLGRFYRLSSSRSTPGTGLGLALVSAIAQQHEAQLQLLDNQPGLRVELMLTPA
jgi:signal transduction histidine kinase